MCVLSICAGDICAVYRWYVHSIFVVVVVVAAINEEREQTSMAVPFFFFNDGRAISSPIFIRIRIFRKKKIKGKFAVH